MLEEALFGEDDPLRAIDAYCGRALGSGIDVVRFRRSSVGLVVGARLEDGREVVVKVHDGELTFPGSRQCTACRPSSQMPACPSRSRW